MSITASSAVLDALRRPVIAAPMAGGPSTPELAAAVTNAGGLGFLAGGMISADRLAADLAATRALTDGPIAVNLFLTGSRSVAVAEAARYAARLADEARRWGVDLGTPFADDDRLAAKLDVLCATPVAAVSFAFDLPDTATVTALHHVGTEVWATVNHPDDAVRADALGCDAIVAQGTEAGAHRGGADDSADFGLLPLLRLVAARIARPLVAAGGLMDGPALAAAIAAGAAAAQLGTAFLGTPEAGTADFHRAALRHGADTRLSRAFTGRRARGIVNAFMTAHDGDAPAAYPEVLQVTRPLLAAARQAGDASTANLWAGQAYALSGETPAAVLVERLTRDAAEALSAARERSATWLTNSG